MEVIEKPAPGCKQGEAKLGAPSDARQRQDLQWRHAEALREYLEAARIDPSNPIFHGTWGVTRMPLGELGEASAQMEQAVALLRRSVAEAHAQLGLVCEQRNLWDQALTHFTSATELAPNEPSYRRNLDLLLERLRRHGKPEPLLHETVTVPQDIPEWSIEPAVQLRFASIDEDSAAEQSQSPVLPPDTSTFLEGSPIVPNEPDRARENAANPNQQSTEQPSAAEQLGSTGPVQDRFQPDQGKGGTSHAEMARSLRQAGDLERAASELEEAVRLDPSNAAWCGELGDLYLAVGNAKSALDLYYRAADLATGEPLYLVSIGAAGRQLGRYIEALAALEQAVDVAPKYVPAYIELGAVYEAQGRLGEALAQYRRAAKLEPDKPGHRHRVGIVCRRLGRLPEAREELSRASSLDPSDAEIHHDLGLTYVARGELDFALREHEQAVRLEPNSASFRHGLGVANALAGQYDEAAEQIEEAVRLAPSHSEYHNELGAVYESQRRFNEALALYRRASSLAPDVGLYHRNVGALLRQIVQEQQRDDEHDFFAMAWSGRLGQAVEELCEAIHLQPEYADACSELGLVYELMGKADASLSEHLRTVELESENPTYRLRLAIQYKRVGMLEEAARELLEVIGMNPSLAEAHNELGAVLELLGRPKEALTKYQKATRLRPDRPVYHYNLGALLEKLGRHEDAVRSLQAALALDSTRDSWRQLLNSVDQQLRAHR